MNPRTFAAVGTAVALALGGACSSGGDETRADTVRPTTTSRPTTTTVKVAGRVLERPSADDLTRALLTVEDMPSGYGMAPPDDNEDDDLSCEKNDRSRKPEHLEKVEVSYMKDIFGPFVGEGLYLFEDEETAEFSLKEFRQALNDCPSMQETDEDGAVTTTHFGPLSFRKFGDETLAVRFNVEGTFPLSGDLVYVRRGAVVMLIAHAGLLGGNADETEQLTDKAYQRLSATIG